MVGGVLSWLGTGTAGRFAASVRPLLLAAISQCSHACRRIAAATVDKPHKPYPPTYTPSSHPPIRPPTYPPIHPPTHLVHGAQRAADGHRRDLTHVARHQHRGSARPQASQEAAKQHGQHAIRGHAQRGPR